MDFTDYHAKYFAYELTKRHPSDSIEKLAGAVAGARVDLNPHQVDAQRDTHIAAIEGKMAQHIHVEHIYHVRWILA